MLVGRDKLYRHNKVGLAGIHLPPLGRQRVYPHLIQLESPIRVVTQVRGVRFPPLGQSDGQHEDGHSPQNYT